MAIQPVDFFQGPGIAEAVIDGKRAQDTGSDPANELAANAVPLNPVPFRESHWHAPLGECRRQRKPGEATSMDFNPFHRYVD